MNKKICYFYLWTNLETNQHYVGSAENYLSRYDNFIDFNNYVYAGEKINAARKEFRDLKYWKYTILKTAEILYIDYDDYINARNTIEDEYISLYDSVNTGFNSKYNLI